MVNLHIKISNEMCSVSVYLGKRFLGTVFLNNQAEVRQMVAILCSVTQVGEIEEHHHSGERNE